MTRMREIYYQLLITPNDEARSCSIGLRRMGLPQLTKESALEMQKGAPEAQFAIFASSEPADANKSSSRSEDDLRFHES